MASRRRWAGELVSRKAEAGTEDYWSAYGVPFRMTLSIHVFLPFLYGFSFALIPGEASNVERSEGSERRRERS